MATKQHDDDRGVSLFSTDLSLVYTPPRSSFRHFLWRWRISFESTFALSMLEGWEKILIVTLMAMFWGLLITGIYRYLPYHLRFLYQRTVYYLSGTEQKDWASVRGVASAMLSTNAPHVPAGEL